jgi:hypothetical protein
MRLLAAFLCAACGITATAADITVDDAWSRATAPTAASGVAFLTIANAGAEADTLQSVTTAAADHVELHTVTKDAAGVLHMEPVPGGIVVPAHGKTELKPGSYHLMLMGLKAPLVEKGTLKLTLTFAHAGTIVAEATVADIAATTAPEDCGCCK